jgi:hypothetical protein
VIKPEATRRSPTSLEDLVRFAPPHRTIPCDNLLNVDGGGDLTYSEEVVLILRGDIPLGPSQNTLSPQGAQGTGVRQRRTAQWDASRTVIYRPRLGR